MGAVVDVPGEPHGAQQHEHDADGQVAGEPARGGGQPRGIHQAINLRQSHDDPEQDGQQRKFHWEHNSHEWAEKDIKNSKVLVHLAELVVCFCKPFIGIRCPFLSNHSGCSKYRRICSLYPSTNAC